MTSLRTGSRCDLEQSQDQRGLGLDGDLNPKIWPSSSGSVFLSPTFGGSDPSPRVCRDAQALWRPCRLGNTCGSSLNNQPQAFPGSPGQLRAEKNQSPTSASRYGGGDSHLPDVTKQGFSHLAATSANSSRLREKY